MTDKDNEKNKPPPVSDKKSSETDFIVFCDQCGSKNTLVARKLEKSHIFQPICAHCSSRLNVEVERQRNKNRQQDFSRQERNYDERNASAKNMNRDRNKYAKNNKPPPVSEENRRETFNGRSARQSTSSKNINNSDKSSSPPPVSDKYRREHAGGNNPKFSEKRKRAEAERQRIEEEQREFRRQKREYDERNASTKDMHRDGNKHTDFSSEHFGLIYILKSKVGGLVKVGETTVNAESRLKSYAKAHHLEGFSVHSEYPVPRDQRRNIEQLTHKKLRKFQVRMGDAREIFECTPEVARQALLDTFIELDIDQEYFESEIKRAIDSLKKEQEKKQRIEAEKRRVEEENQRRIEEERQRVEEEKRRISQHEHQKNEKIKLQRFIKNLGVMFLFWCLIPLTTIAITAQGGTAGGILGGVIVIGSTGLGFKYMDFEVWFSHTWVIVFMFEARILELVIHSPQLSYKYLSNIVTW